MCISWVGIFTFLMDLDPEETPPAGSRLGSSAQEVRGTQRYTANLPYVMNAWLKFRLLTQKKYVCAIIILHITVNVFENVT